MLTKGNIDGVEIFSLKTFPDQRGYFREIVRKDNAILREGFAQASISYMRSDVAKAWHMHSKQVDWWYVVSGVLKVAAVDWREESPTKYALDEVTLGDECPAALIRIPPGCLHGCKVLQGPATLLYLASHTYDPNDDIRIAHDAPVYLKNGTLTAYDWVSGPEIK
jgi:dTDP-4-dehydrorhamnose 3,5-epimerase